MELTRFWLLVGATGVACSCVYLAVLMATGGVGP